MKVAVFPLTFFLLVFFVQQFDFNSSTWKSLLQPFMKPSGRGLSRFSPQPTSAAWKIAGLFCLLIKTFFFKFVACCGTEMFSSYHRINWQSFSLSLGSLFFFFLSLAPYHQQNIPLGLCAARPSEKGLIELNWINMTLCMSFQPKRNIALWCPRVYDYTGYWFQHLKATCVSSYHPNSPLSLSLSWLLVYSEARLNRKHR